MNESTAAWALGVFANLGLGGIALWYLRDRRRDHVATRIAERTEQAQIDLSSVTAAEAHVALMERAFAAERASWERRMREVETALAELRRMEREQAISVERLRTERERLRRELLQCRARLADIEARALRAGIQLAPDTTQGGA